MICKETIVSAGLLPRNLPLTVGWSLGSRLVAGCLLKTAIGFERCRRCWADGAVKQQSLCVAVLEPWGPGSAIPAYPGAIKKHHLV